MDLANFSKYLTAKGSISPSAPQQVKQEFWVARATQKHNDSYDYSKVVYTKSSDKVIVICKVCGTEFLIEANSHVCKGSGCRCRSKLSNRYTTETFKEIIPEKIKSVYGIEKIVYKSMRDPVTLVCRAHGEFSCTAQNVKNGVAGCQKCHPIQKDSKESFIEKASKTHGYKYDYSKVKYINSHTNITVICPLHGDFTIRPNNHINSKHGCPECANVVKPTTLYIIKIFGLLKVPCIKVGITSNFPHRNSCILHEIKKLNPLAFIEPIVVTRVPDPKKVEMQVLQELKESRILGLPAFPGHTEILELKALDPALKIIENYKE